MAVDQRAAPHQNAGAVRRFLHRQRVERKDRAVGGRGVGRPERPVVRPCGVGEAGEGEEIFLRPDARGEGGRDHRHRRHLRAIHRRRRAGGGFGKDGEVERLPRQVRRALQRVDGDRGARMRRADRRQAGRKPELRNGGQGGDTRLGGPRRRAHRLHRGAEPVEGRAELRQRLAPQRGQNHALRTAVKEVGAQQRLQSLHMGRDRARRHAQLLRSRREPAKPRRRLKGAKGVQRRGARAWR